MINNVLGVKNKKYKNILFIFIIVLEIFIFFIVYSFYYSDNVLKKYLYNRTLIVVDDNSRDNNIALLSNIDDVVSVYNLYPNIVGKIDNYSYTFEYIKLPNVDSINKNEVIVPSNLGFSVGEKIIVNINNNDYQLYVKDILDKNLGIDVFIVNEDFIKLFCQTNEYGVIVDSYNNIKDVINYIANMDYSVNIKNTKGLSILNNYEFILSLLIIFILFILLFILYIILVSINDIIKLSKREIVIMKVVGFKDSKIVYLLLLNMFKLLFSAYLISSLFLIIINLFIEFRYYLLILFITLITIVILLLLSSINIFIKIRKVSPKKLVRYNKL